MVSSPSHFGVQYACLLQRLSQHKFNTASDRVIITARDTDHVTTCYMVCISCCNNYSILTSTAASSETLCYLPMHHEHLHTQVKCGAVHILVYRGMKNHVADPVLSLCILYNVQESRVPGMLQKCSRHNNQRKMFSGVSVLMYGTCFCDVCI